MKIKKTVSLVIMTVLSIIMAACSSGKNSEGEKFVKVADGHFVRDGKPYYYVGTNFWYGAILGSEGRGGDRKRLCQELDDMKEMGIDNLHKDTRRQRRRGRSADKS